MVGDTLADLGMGRSANLGATVGVLSGIGSHSELDPHADHLVRYKLFNVSFQCIQLKHVGEILPLVLGTEHGKKMSSTN